MNPLNANHFFAQQNYPQTPADKGPLLIGEALRNGENMGQLIRLAGNTGCSKVYLIRGLHQPNTGKITRVSETAGKTIPWEFIDASELMEKLSSRYQLVALETSPTSTNLFNTPLPAHMALVVGNESQGISKELLQQCRLQVHIPLTGPVKSLNEAQAAGLCLFEWLRQHILV